MPLNDLEIIRSWPNKSITTEINWDAIKIPLDEFSNKTNRNLEQLARDCLSDVYEFDNDGNANNVKDLLASLTTNVAITGGNIDGAVIGGTDPETGKFSSLDVSTTTRYYVIPALNFIPHANTDRNYRSVSGAFPYLFNVDGAFAARSFIAPVHLPHGATMTSMTMCYYRDDAAASITVSLNRFANEVNWDQQIRLLTGTSTTGNHSLIGSISGSSGIIDNVTYNYVLTLAIDNNNNISDSALCSVIIAYTITSILP